MSAVQKEGRRIYAREGTSAKSTIAQFNQQSVHSDSQKTNFLNYPLYFEPCKSFGFYISRVFVQLSVRFQL